MKQPLLLSVIIPAYNRLEPLRLTLQTAALAAARLPAGDVEIILVDDGSTPPLVEQLGNFDCGHPVIHCRQNNSGSIVARNHGLSRSRGDYVQFLDSDDLVHPDKFVRQLDLMRATRTDVSYCDMAEAVLNVDGGIGAYRPTQVYAVETDPARFYLRVQPAPHAPIYRRAYLEATAGAPLVLDDRRMDPAGDVWLYYNLAPHPARIVKLTAPCAVTVAHADARYSQHWERLGAAALLLMEQFMARCPDEHGTSDVRATIAQCAFDSWRRLPYDFDRSFDSRMFAVWRRAPAGTPVPGGRGFRCLARALGARAAGRLLRRWRGHNYASCRTLGDDELRRLMTAYS